MQIRDILDGLEQDIMFTGVAALSAEYAVVSGVVRSLEAQSKEHTILLVYDAGDWRQHVLQAPTTSLCLVDKDLLYTLTPFGTVIQVTKQGFDSMVVDPSGTHFNNLRNATEITSRVGQLFVVGHGRECMAGQFGQTSFAPLSQASMTSDPVSGFYSSEVEADSLLHAVGLKGEIWYFERSAWHEVASPTNVRLTRVRLGAAGDLIVCGAAGTLFHGRRDVWSPIDVSTRSNFWDLAVFKDETYAATSESLFQIDQHHNARELRASDGPVPASYSYLAGTQECLWSVGATSIARFDGTQWSIDFQP